MKKIILGAFLLGLGVLFCTLHYNTFGGDTRKLEGYFAFTSQFQLHKRSTDFVYKERDFD